MPDLDSILPLFFVQLVLFEDTEKERQMVHTVITRKKLKNPTHKLDKSFRSESALDFMCTNRSHLGYILISRSSSNSYGVGWVPARSVPILPIEWSNNAAAVD